MGCCGGGNDQNNKKIKDWGTEKQENQSSGNVNPLLILLGIIIIGILVYYFVR